MLPNLLPDQMLRKLPMLVAVLMLCGCGDRPEVRKGAAKTRAIAAHAAAAAGSTTGVTPWEGELPLLGSKVELEPTPAGEAEAVDDATDPNGCGCEDEPNSDRPTETYIEDGEPNSPLDPLTEEQFERLKAKILEEMARDLKEAQEIEPQSSAEPDAPPPVELADQTEIIWWPYSPESLRTAQHIAKPIWVHVRKDDCVPCDRLEAEVFSAARVVYAMNMNFTPIWLNESKVGPLPASWNITEYPTDVLVDQKTLKAVYRESEAVFPAQYYLRRIERFRDPTKRLRNVSTGGAYYPVSNRSRWRMSNGRPATWRHLTQGNHAGMFDREWLSQLSFDELQSLHSDHHRELKGTGRVQWQYVVRP